MQPLNFFSAKEAINYSNLTFLEAEKSKHKSTIITFNLRSGITIGGGKKRIEKPLRGTTEKVKCLQVT